MPNKLTVKWVIESESGFDITGSEAIIFGDNEVIDVYEWETKLLNLAKDNHGFNCGLKRLRTTLSSV